MQGIQKLSQLETPGKKKIVQENYGPNWKQTKKDLRWLCPVPWKTQ